MKGFHSVLFVFSSCVSHCLAAGTLYGDDGPVDLSSEEFCTDVSQYSDKYYEEGPEECCTTAYQPTCETKIKNVCMDVTNTICKPFVTPASGVEIQKNPPSGDGKPGTKAVLDTQYVDLFECNPVDVVLTHIKEVPECKPVTSLNCETGWKVVGGKKVWSGEEDCEEVTWQDCKLVEKEVPFHAIESRCGPNKDNPREPFSTCANKTVDVPVPVNKPEFVEGTKCEQVTKKECIDIPYKDCSKPVKKCDSSQVNVRKPKQDFTHKKKCLLPSDIERLAGGR